MDQLPLAKPRRKRDKKLRKSMRSHYDCVVGNQDCTPQTVMDHIKTRGSGGHDLESNGWKLCFKHHEERGRLPLAKFANKYNLQGLLMEKGWEFDEFSQRWIPPEEVRKA